MLWPMSITRAATPFPPRSSSLVLFDRYICPSLAVSAFVLYGSMDVLRFPWPYKRASHHVLYYDKLRFLGLPNFLSFGAALISQLCVCVNSFCCCTYLCLEFVTERRVVEEENVYSCVCVSSY